ncbi:MAG: DUF697 domain-containing protein [Planctomycetaceae bacterium]|nr:DUF697 domain-containing protein [Planctomycetaceae bacterium]
MLRTAWKLLRTAIIVIGVLLTFFAALEVLRAYQTLYNFQPVVAYIFLAVVLGLLIWLFAYVWINLAAFPRPLIAPRIDDVETASEHQLKKHLHYLRRFMQRLAINELLSESQRMLLAEAAARLESPLPSDRGGCLALIHSMENDRIRPALKTLDDLASRQVRDSMRDIMLFVTLSPYKSSDLLIVLYRNLMMLVRIVRVYRVRPALTEQVRIFSDIINVIATVNYINMGRNLIEGIGSRVPGVGRFIDDIAQGIGAGFMTTIAGHAAMDRCRSFRGWNEQEANRHMLTQVGDFYTDVKDIFFKDVWGSLRSRAGVTIGDAKEKVADAIDETGSALDDFIRTPIKAVYTAGQSVIDFSAAGAAAVRDSGTQGVSLLSKALRKTGRLFKKPFSKGR